MALRHGMFGTITHNSWRAMIDRCTSPTTHGYKNYGGRGISVCPQWLGPSGFEYFLQHVGERPSRRHSIDRIDCNGNYEPGNVRWATPEEQAANLRRNVLVTAFSKTQTVTQWALSIGMEEDTLRGRIDAGWEPERALTQPVAPRGQEVVEAAKRLGISKYSIYDRIRKGWPIERALTTPRTRNAEGPLLLPRRKPRRRASKRILDRSAG
jgi:hypothetical protein